jgi:hypothetical protein
VAEAGLEADWDVWEEPNFKGWWDASREQFFATWERAHRVLKELNPQARMVGPSLNRYDRDYLEAFLLYAKTHDALPDVLSWHEIIPEHEPARIEAHVAEIRAFMAAQAIEIDGIEINEYISHDRMTDPGMHVWYLTYLEKARVRGACKAAWLEPETGIFNAATPTLGGLLTSRAETARDLVGLHPNPSRIKPIGSRLLTCILPALLAVSPLQAGTEANPDENPPDIVFILLDDLRFDGLSYKGHPYVETPHIDKLRSLGADVANAFVTTSMCCPSRATFLTGTHASQHGVIDNETSEYNPEVTPPLTRYLQEAGYKTALIGKWHMGDSAHPRPSLTTG